MKQLIWHWRILFLSLIIFLLVNAFEHDSQLNPSVSDYLHFSSKQYKPYQTITINDPANQSAGIYFRVSQRGVDYVAKLISNALPEIFQRMVLPTISESSLMLKDAVITKLEQPEINVKFIKGFGVEIAIRLPELRVSGETELGLLFASYNAQMLAISNNLTFHMRVNIHRNLNEEFTKVVVANCTVNPGTLNLQYFGDDAGEFYTIGNLIQNGINSAIRDKICVLPILISEFIREKIDHLMKPPKINNFTDKMSNKSEKFMSSEKIQPSVIDHLCDRGFFPESKLEEDDNDPEVNLVKVNGTWMPDLSLVYPPTFSNKDLIFGIDGGIVVNGANVSRFVQRPKFKNETVIRDQMLGLIISEYVPNTLFHHIFSRKLGSISITYSFRQLPKMLHSILKHTCLECKLVLLANLTTLPHASINQSGIVLLLEGDISAIFQRKNSSNNLLTASGQLRVVIKPHFRHSRLYNDVFLAGVDFKVYKAGLSGMVAGAVRKILLFLIPRAIWPRIQQRLRLAVNYKGVRIPRICTLEFKHLHLDYIGHAAVLSSDFDVDLPLLIKSFKLFMDEKQRHADTKAKLESVFRYL